MNSFKQVLLFSVIATLFSCEKQEVAEKHYDNYHDYLADKAVLSIQIIGDEKWVYSTKICDTCYRRPEMSSIPHIQQLTIIADTTFNYTEPYYYQGTPIVDNNGNIFIGNYIEIYQYLGLNNYQTFLETNEFFFSRFTFDNENNIWLTGYDGIAFWNGTELKVYNEENNAKLTNITHGMAIDQDGAVWVSLDYEGLLKIAGDEWQKIPQNEIPGLHEHSYLRGPIVDNENTLWYEVFSPDTTSNILSYKNKAWTYHLTHDNVYPNIEQDSKGTIWLIYNKYIDGGTYQNKLKYYENNEWTDFNISDINAHITTVNADDNTVYIGTRNGLVEKSW